MTTYFSSFVNHSKIADQIKELLSSLPKAIITSSVLDEIAKDEAATSFAKVTKKLSKQR